MIGTERAKTSVREEATIRPSDGGSAYAAGFARLAIDLHDAQDLSETISRILGVAQRVVPCDFTGLVLRCRGGTFCTADGCDPRVVAADQLQVDCDEGPWLSRGTDRRSMVTADTAQDPRWPRWGPRVALLGLRSLLSIRLQTSRSGQSDLGLLTFYSAGPGRFATADEAAAYLLTCHASVAIAAARHAASLALAAQTRTVIGQAQGLLMERFDLNAEQAFAVLRRYSQDGNIKLHDVAGRVIETRRLPSAPPGRRTGSSPSMTRRVVLADACGDL